MPSKSSRAASRQAKVRQRRRRGKAAPQAFQAAPTERKVDDEGRELAAAPGSPRASSTSRAFSTSTRPSRRARGAAAAEVEPSYAYMGVELRRIGIVAGLIVAILIVLTFVLGG